MIYPRNIKNDNNIENAMFDTKIDIKDNIEKDLLVNQIYYTTLLKDFILKELPNNERDINNSTTFHIPSTPGDR